MGGFDDASTVQTSDPTGGAAARCLEIDDLVAMVEGTLSPVRAEAVLGHVDRCAACAEVIANLGSLEGPNRRIGRYQIEKLLGTGGMGIVYAAFDPELQRKVAIKLVRPDSTNEALQAMMIEEARTLARLAHPNVVAVFDVGEHDGEVYFATELVDGTTLGEWQQQRAREDIVGAWIQVARGLAAAHEAGVIHRDVKPSNVLVGRDGRARIGDFGIAHREEREPVASDVVAGTPAYMAPEQKSGLVDARADQFSTAVALGEALTGRRPAAGELLDLEPPALAAAINRALANVPAARFPSMTAFADALAAAIAPRRSRAKLVAVAAAAGAVLAAGVAAVTLRGAGDTGCHAPAVPARIWSPARRAALAAVMPADLGPTVDRHVARWTTAANEICAAPAAMQVMQTRCLNRHLAQLEGVLASWEAAPPRSGFQAHLAMDLPHIAWCSAASLAVTGEPTDAQAAEIAKLQAEVDAVTGNTPADIARIEQLRVRARGTSQPLARYLTRMLASMRRGDVPTQLATLRAELGTQPDDFSKVTVMMDLVSLLGADELPEAERIAAQARALIARLGGDAILEAELDFHLGGTLRKGERTADAISALERAHHGMAQALGADSPQVANVLVVLAGAYYARDGITSKQAREVAIAADAIWAQHAIPIPSVLIATTVAEFLAQVGRAKQIALEVYGPNSEAMFHGELALMEAYDIAEQLDEAIAHGRAADELAAKLKLKIARVPYVRGQIARMLLDTGRASEALPLAEQALAIATSMGLEDEAATARSVLGRALFEVGRAPEAKKHLEDALAYLVRTNAASRYRGKVRFSLARITGDVDEARVARSEVAAFETTPDADVAKSPVGAPHLLRDMRALLATIDAWIAAHK